jgi:hypothetical protein
VLTCRTNLLTVCWLCLYYSERRRTVRQIGTRAHPELTFAFVVLFPGELSKRLPAPHDKKRKVQFVACGFWSNHFQCCRKSPSSIETSNSYSLCEQASKQWRKNIEKYERGGKYFHTATMNVSALLNFY